ncbi:acyl-CoA reductase [Aegicerativicinus sediminis]|uniref:acyl-CoA reductase n=1 Tax=Aegicerativicinus sediminis TaxID=2893202 RepID=UPI001E461A22|nr:acyl-CoA reductase [Aegicerativicinus sediminis]
MQLNQRIEAFTKLGALLYQYVNIKKEKKTFQDEALLSLDDICLKANQQNSWFTEDNILHSLEGWAEQLTSEQLHKWLEPYNLKKSCCKTVAIIMAGNIPLVGFHDFLSVLVSGHKVLIKLSSNDDVLLKGIVKLLIQIEPEYSPLISFTDKQLSDFDAVIATGSNNTSRYFEYYFGKNPNIIRKNRNSIAILSGEESEEDLSLLCNDVMRYYGLGCRNVSKLFVPENYNFDKFFNALYNWKDIINENRYANNYDYNKAVYLMSEFQLLDNGFVILKEDPNYASPISVIFYEYYNSLDDLKNRIASEKDLIQCIVSKGIFEDEVSFGTTQKPQLWNYADNVDTIEFLLSICE